MTPENWGGMSNVLFFGGENLVDSSKNFWSCLGMRLRTTHDLVIDKMSCLDANQIY